MTTIFEKTCPKNQPARFLTTVTHFWHFSNCKNLPEKPARSIFDDSYTLWALFFFKNRTGPKGSPGARAQGFPWGPGPRVPLGPGSKG